MKKFHMTLAVSNIPTSVHEYSQRPSQPPDWIIPDHYALWRTATLNLSIRTPSTAHSQPLRHLDWETKKPTDLPLRWTVTESPGNALPPSNELMR